MQTRLIIKRKGDAPEAAPLGERSLTEPLITIGSDPHASLRLNAANVAPEQAVIINEGGDMLLINRADGTALNDELLAREVRRPLAHGDRLLIGDFLIIFANTTREAKVKANTGARPTTLLNAEDVPDRQMPVETAANTAEATDNNHDRAPRNFAAILDSLRTEEDSFYFLVEGGLRNGERIVIKNTEMPLGWDETGQRISFEPERVVAARATLRKDWSGVVVQTLGVGMVAVNGEPVENARHLRNGDRLIIIPAAVTAAYNQSVLIFHEPASLMVLDSLLPQKLPPPVAPQPPAEENASLASLDQPGPLATRKRTGLFDSSRRYFGYFTPFEILLMIIGTLVTATLIFLVLEYSS